MLRRGQYLQFSFLLQGRVSARGDLLSSFWLVEARTNWSERFLFRRRPNMILESNKGLVVLVFPRISQFLVIVYSRAGQELRDTEEKRWIYRLASIVPRGLNLLD